MGLAGALPICSRPQFYYTVKLKKVKEKALESRAFYNEFDL
jgi:hypothetical protein